MIPGITEILMLALIIAGLFILPRITERGREARHAFARTEPGISGPMRLAIAASLLWLSAAALYLEPWKESMARFLVFGLGPVALAWGVNWVLAGFRGR
ncbi:MAG: hypothetical protein HZA01_00475 [Nitrospinae bacterium]|nr:hypothetical protein [Nitrospinota bacterium]